MINTSILLLPRIRKMLTSGKTLKSYEDACIKQIENCMIRLVASHFMAAKHEVQ